MVDDYQKATELKVEQLRELARDIYANCEKADCYISMREEIQLANSYIERAKALEKTLTL
jgi:hypothetical protein